MLSSRVPRGALRSPPPPAFGPRRGRPYRHRRLAGPKCALHCARASHSGPTGTEAASILPPGVPDSDCTFARARVLCTHPEFSSTCSPHSPHGGRMPIPPKPLPSQLGPQFSTTAAREAGVSRARLRAQDLTAPFHGARRTASDIQAENDALAADSAPLAPARAAARRMASKARSFLTVMAPGGFICGRSAAVIRGYPVRAPEELDVGVLSPRRAPKGAGVAGRRIEPHLVELEWLDGIPISSPATTWTMLARHLSVRGLTIVGDAIVRVPRDRFGTRHPEQADATLEQLWHAVEAGRHVGVKKLRAAFQRIRVGSSSPLESDYRLDAEDAGLPEPVLDFEVRDGRGRLLGISEFAYPSYRTVVEIEGDHHRTSKLQWNRDIQKYRDYAAEGWEVVRLTAADVRRTRTAARIVGAVLSRRA